MVRLFPSLEIFVPDYPEEHGFYELELPDAFRWIKQEAKCWLPTEHLIHLASPMLRVTATTGRHECYLQSTSMGHFSGPSGLTVMAHIIFICRRSL